MKKNFFVVAVFLLVTAKSQNYQWTKSVVGSKDGKNNIINCVANDSSGDVFTTGCFVGTKVNFNSQELPLLLSSVNPTTPAIFFSKYSSEGNCLWTKAILTTDGAGHSIAADKMGNVYLTGVFSGKAVDFDPGPRLQG